MPITISVVAYYERWSGTLAAWLGRNAAAPEAAAPTPGDAVAVQVVAWHAFRAPRAAVLPWLVPSDLPSPLAEAPPLIPTSARPWTGWRPQPQYGWTSP